MLADLISTDLLNGIWWAALPRTFDLLRCTCGLKESHDGVLRLLEVSKA